MAENVVPFSGFPGAIRPVPDPLGLYLRAGFNDHIELASMIASGDASCTRKIFRAARKNFLKNKYALRVTSSR